MDWFKRTQEDAEGKTSEENSTQNIKTEHSDNEHEKGEQNQLQNEIKTQTEHLQSISKKLTDVKKEYDEAVGKLILVKKDLIQKNKDMNSLNTLSSISQKTTTSQQNGKIYSEKIKKEKDILEDIKSQINKGKKEMEEIKVRKTDSLSELEQLKMEYPATESRLETMFTQIKKSQEELENIETKKQKIMDEINKIKNTNQITNKNSSDQSKESKHVVEAASAVIASMKNKVNIAEKEIITIRQMLGKERNEHQATKKQLESLKKSDKTSHQNKS